MLGVSRAVDKYREAALRKPKAGQNTPGGVNTCSPTRKFFGKPPIFSVPFVLNRKSSLVLLIASCDISQLQNNFGDWQSY